MSKEFYEYISKRIILFFEKNDSNILNGSRYCLVLDNQDTVDELSLIFNDYAINNKITKTWSYIPPNFTEATYETIALNLNYNEIAIVFKTSDMTEDFLATLRNTKTTMLMITSSPIDSISKGTDDLSSSGFPFHKDSIVQDTIKSIQESMLDDVSKSILEFEIKRHSEDSNVNQNSIFEYENILAILNNKTITKDDFISFRLFYDEELKHLSGKKLDSKLRENNDMFETIDKSIKYGDPEKDLDKSYDYVLINKLMKSDEETWFHNLTYKDIKKSKDAKQNSEDTNLEVLEITIYSEDITSYKFEENKNFFICDDGLTAAKKRNKNILIFNSLCKNKLTMECNFNRKIKKEEITTEEEFSLYKNNLMVNFFHNEKSCTFHKVKISDLNTKTNKHEFKFCIIDLTEDCFTTLTTFYTIKYTKAKRCLCISNNYEDIIINHKQEDIVTENIIPNSVYECDYNTALRLKVDEEVINDNNGNLDLKVSIENISVPIMIKYDTKKSISLSPIQAFKLKNLNKASFKKGSENNLFILGTNEYIVRPDFSDNLYMEEMFVNSSCFSLKVNENGKIDELTNTLPTDIENAYFELINYYKKNETLPSLTYYNEELIYILNKYINAIKLHFESIKDKQTLDLKTKNILKLGIVEYLNKSQEICFTPLNPLIVYYQLTLQKENNFNNFNNLNDEFLQKLSPSNLLPYIKNSDQTLYKSVDFSSLYSFEWLYFAPINNKKYRGAKHFISKVVFEKIREYISHFKFLFSDIDNKEFKINLLNMGDCKEVFIGILRFYQQTIKKDITKDSIINFVINIYSNSDHSSNNFIALTDFYNLKNFIENSEIKFDSSYNSTDIANILTSKIKCFFKSDDTDKFEYAHITFYEMDSKTEINHVNSDDVKTGIMLNGLLSGLPSVYYGEQYKTALGLKFASKNEFIDFVAVFNSLHNSTSNIYNKNTSLSTEIDKLSIDYMNKVYKSSNWLTFIDPKVDLNFFKSDDINLLIIHYSDQYTSSSSYDAITVTKKSKQYKDIISEFFKSRNVAVTEDNIAKLICMFNAINGDWLLKLIATNGQFPREKISILSAIKIAVAYYKHSNIIWVPLSLEEILRVSGAVGLSQSLGILSAKNLNFKKGATSDDIMLVGIENIDNKLYVHIQPIEVKIGNTKPMLNKAKYQVNHTYNEFMQILLPSDELQKKSLECKMIKNFIMQLVVVSAEKLELYDVFNNQSFSKVINDYRTDLLNDNFTIATHLTKHIKNGCIIAFNNTIDCSRYTGTSTFEILEIPEQLAVEYLVKDIDEIEDLITYDKQFDSRLKYEYIEHSTVSSNEIIPQDVNDITTQDVSNITTQDVDDITTQDVDDITTQDVNDDKGIKILFGKNKTDGEDIFWQPNDTDKVLNTNTGIIGTMGTGKTQFTKSIIAQLYNQSHKNIGNDNLGMLIFDYKGDYNNTKTDFLNATNATVLSVYKLPFNPFSLYKTSTIKPLLPLHTANSFTDTIGKIFQLGENQRQILFSCIMEAYNSKGIDEDCPDTWDKPVPTFKDVYNIYSNNDNIKKNDKLFASMNKIYKFQIFESETDKTQTLYDLLDKVVVIDLAGNDEDIQNLVVAIILDLFYSEMQSKGSSKLDGKYRQITKMILVDEADNFMRGGFSSLNKILKESREFGVGTILSTQFLEHFHGYAECILTWIVHKVPNLKNADIRFVFQTEKGSEAEKTLFNDVKQLGKHSSIVRMGSKNSILYIQDQTFWELIQNK